jgi:hypothetical protein
MATKHIKTSVRVSQRLAEIARNMGGGTLEVGFLEDATYPDGTPVAAAMFWLEFGHGGHFPSPPRPFFKPMIEKESPTWPATMADLAKKLDYNGPRVLALMGEEIDGALKESLTHLDAPALSPTTLALRAKFWSNPGDIRIRDVLQAQKDAKSPGADLASGTQAKPGVWTGHALQSTGYRVKGGTFRLSAATRKYVKAGTP